MSETLAGITLEMWLLILTAVGIAIAIVSIVISFNPHDPERKYHQAIERFKDTRRYLKDKRTELIAQASEYYKKSFDFTSIKCDIGGESFDCNLLSKEEWVPESAKLLEEVVLSQDTNWSNSIENLENEHKDVVLTECINELNYLWPKRKRSDILKYSDLIGNYDSPANWWNSPSYMLTNVRGGDQLKLTFKLGMYWNYQDTLEALAFEAASKAEKTRNNTFKMAQLRARKNLGGPTEFNKRYSGFGVLTISIFPRKGTYRFIMHERLKGSVATSEGVIHVVPAGDFQPSSNSALVFERDFDFWKNIMREFNEEIINPDKENANIKYAVDWINDLPFKDFSYYKKNGQIRVYYLGFGLDPLNLKPLLLTALVFSEEAFEKIVPTPYETNLEGILLWKHKGKEFEGYAFNEEDVKYFLKQTRLEVGGRACLMAAWNFRDQLLGR